MNDENLHKSNGQSTGGSRFALFSLGIGDAARYVTDSVGRVVLWLTFDRLINEIEIKCQKIDVLRTRLGYSIEEVRKILKREGIEGIDRRLGS